MNILDEVKQYLRDHPDRRRLAAETGVSEEWIKKLLSGRRPDPRVSSVQRIIDHKRKSGDVSATDHHERGTQ